MECGCVAFLIKNETSLSFSSIMKIFDKYVVLPVSGNFMDNDFTKPIQVN